MPVKLLAEHQFVFLSLKEGCTGLSEYTLVKTPHCWKSNVVAHMVSILRYCTILIPGYSKEAMKKVQQYQAIERFEATVETEAIVNAKYQ